MRDFMAAELSLFMTVLLYYSLPTTATPNVLMLSFSLSLLFFLCLPFVRLAALNRGPH